MNRNTKQRKIIYDVVLKHMDHPDVDSIFNDVHKEDPKISKATVYRNLNLLSEQGLIKNIKVPSGVRFDFNVEPHDHILCTKCGKLIDSPIISNDKIVTELEIKTGFKILNHDMLFEAICFECQNKK